VAAAGPKKKVQLAELATRLLAWPWCDVPLNDNNRLLCVNSGLQPVASLQRPLVGFKGFMHGWGLVVREAWACLEMASGANY